MSKLNQLKDWFRDKEGILVAFSGGVDSALLLKVGYEVLGEKILAVTATSPLNTSAELESAKKVAEEIGAKHLVVELNDLNNQDVSSNPPDRCYFCKKTRFLKLLELGKKQNIKFVVEGSNMDDLNDYRPGLKAVDELGIKSPLQEIGFNKVEIRQIAKELGISVWNKPSEPCLATRIPYYEEITIEKLYRVSKAEDYLKQLGFIQVRVRDHNGLARIEVLSEQMNEIIENRNKVESIFKDIGFKYITLDIEGYRTGSMNISI